ncbi:hypothetical protein B484DRAFT_401286 [Ochromonadaceae sp. CCMP2298]|nr:hypothetical protein B484DRAFT_401286 [Ochromonadaceae sp. CCMP2298]
MKFIVLLVVVMIVCVGAFRPTAMPKVRHTQGTSALQASFLESSFNVAELFSSPAAKYNGEFIDQSLKAVVAAPKPEGYEYGAVNDAGLTFLAFGMLAACILGAVVPFVLSVGESALEQQRRFEDKDKITSNAFTLKRGKK